LIAGLDWDQELQDLIVQEIWQRLCKISQIAITSYVPLERTNYKKNPKWMNKAARATRKRKVVKWQRFKLSQSYNDLAEYRLARKQAARAYREV
jgi:hypothetical protein